MAKPLTRLVMVLPVPEAKRIRAMARTQRIAVSRFIRNAVQRALEVQ